jgi:TPR repeat protein
MGMANLLGQLGMTKNPYAAIPLLRQAADQADLDVPQPAYVFGMLLLGEFDQVDIPIHLLTQAVPPNTTNEPIEPRIKEARRLIERAAYLSFAPAQYKLGFSYEHAKMGCPFDPLLSVQYYSLASQQGEVEADMALSKWFLCGSQGAFEKDEVLAVTFAEKAAKRGLPSAEFAMGYYFEVGVGVKKDIEAARKWYQKVSH